MLDTVGESNVNNNVYSSDEECVVKTRSGWHTGVGDFNANKGISDVDYYTAGGSSEATNYSNI